MIRIPILFIIDVLRDFGGAEKNLMQLVSRLDPSRYEPFVFCLKGGKVFEELRNRGVKISNLEITRIYAPSALIKGWRLSRFMRANRVQVVVTYFESSDFWGALSARLAGVPVVISNRRDLGFSLKRRHIIAYRFFNRFFTRIIAVCDAVKEHLIKEERVERSKISTVYNGVDILDILPSGTLKASLGVADDERVVTMVANLHPVKGHENLLEAARLVCDEIPAVKFLFVGVDKGGYSEHLRQVTRRLVLQGNVIFTGYRHDVAEILAVSDVCVLSSTSEGMSNAILEYMASGNPVIATDVGGNAELINDGETGFLVPPDNPQSMARSISLLLENHDVRIEMGRKAKERAQTLFSTQAMVQAVDSLVTSELERQRKLKERAA